MILIGKAKEDFFKWFTITILNCKTERLKRFYSLAFEGKKDTEKNALIIEWFDSVGIIIEVAPTYYDGWTFLPIVYDNLGNKHDIDIDYKSRQEATKQAILKANQIYNEKTTV